MNRVDPMTVDAIAFVLILSILPLVSYGTMSESVLVWGAGLFLLIIGGLIPLASEFGIRESGEA